MKKIILVAALVLGFAVAASAQPRAIGLRGGWGVEASYQHSFGADFLQADLGLNTFDSVHGSVVYNFMIAQPSWTSRGEWGFYAGPAVKMGYLWVGGYLAVGAQVGLEYNFDFPLQVSLDIRPAVGVAMEGGSCSIYGAEAILGSIPCLSLRYRF